MENVDGLEVLSEEECRCLLGQARVGRVAISVDALPVVVPVNYRVVDDSVVFFTGPGRKLRAATANTVIAFEVDRIDETTETGWSVLVVGVASEATDSDLAASARHLGLRPWVAGDRSHLVRLRTEFLSGRRIVPNHHAN